MSDEAPAVTNNDLARGSLLLSACCWARWSALALAIACGIAMVAAGRAELVGMLAGAGALAVLSLNALQGILSVRLCRSLRPAGACRGVRVALGTQVLQVLAGLVAVAGIPLDFGWPYRSLAALVAGSLVATEYGLSAGVAATGRSMHCPSRPIRDADTFYGCIFPFGAILFALSCIAQVLASAGSELMLNLVEILFPPVAMVYVIALLLLPFTWMANTARAAELARWLGEVTAEDVMPYFARAGGPRTGQSTGGQ